MKVPKIKLPKYNSLVKFLEKRFPEILLILLLLLICIISLQPGKYLLSNDNYSPELNPTLSVSRYLQSPAWRGYRVLGFASESEQADIFRSFLFSISDNLLPRWSISQLFSLLSLTIGTISMAYFVKLFIYDFVSKKYSKYVFLLSGVLYFTTLWTAWVFNFNIMPYITQFGFLPLLVLSLYILFKKWSYKNLLFYLLSLILFTSSCVIATAFFVNLVLLLILTVYFGVIHKIETRRVLISIGIFLLTQIFWILPFIQYTFSSSQDIIDSYTNRAITANTIDLEADMMNLVNSARFYTRLLGTVDDPRIDKYVFPMSEDFQAYDIFKVVGLLPFIFSIIGLVFVVIKKKWKLIPLWVLLLGILFLIKNQNAPFGGIYLWLQENINIFKQVFRWVSSKLSQPYLTVLAITSSIGFLYLLEFFSSYFTKKTRKIFVLIPLIVLLSTLLFYSGYLFKGQLFTDRALVNLPSQYYSLRNEMSEDTKSRIFYAPPANNGYFREYDWGFVGSQFLGYILQNPLVDMSLAIGSDVGEKAVLELTNDFNSGDIQELNNDFNKYDIKYVLVDRSLIKGRYGHSLNWEQISSYTESWEKIWSQDFLELYSVNEQREYKYIESYGESDVLNNGSFVRKYAQEPVFSALNVDFNDAYIQGNYLLKSDIYTGIDTVLYSNYRDLDISKVPTNIEKLSTDIILSPSLPTINGLDDNSYKKFSIPSSNNYLYVIGDNVFDEESVNNGVNIYDGWGEIGNISIASNSSSQKLDLTDNFSNTESGDCSGGKYKILPEVTPQEVSSGFSIEGTSELPCLYNVINLDKRMNYTVQIHLNWESNEENLLGYCLYSSSKGSCLNKEKFLYTNDGYGDITYTIPTLVKGSDDISLTLYALNPSGRKASLIVREVDLIYSSDFVSVEPYETSLDTRERILKMEKNGKIAIRIPLIENGNSYIYTSKKDFEIWQPSIAEDSSLAYEVSLDNGLKQITQKQYINQYQELFITTPLKKLLWYWSGENINNIPSTLCLTYVGDDKCFVDSTFYDDRVSSDSRVFSSSINENARLDVSYNGISFHNETENILKDFVVMEIPQEWSKFAYKSILPREYLEYETESIGDSSNSTFYSISTKTIKETNSLISIPQAKSDGWVAVGFTNYFLKVLPDSTKVYLEGWKQGWDITSIGNVNSVFIFYWPNLLSYFGYILILITGTYLTVKFIEEKRDGKK